jgi:ATP-dependent RNA helicase DOB1
VQLQEAARRVAKVCIESKLDIDEEEFVSSFKPDLMEVTLAWVKGGKFCDVCKLTDMFEGTIVRAIRRLEELLRQLALAARAIGNTELEQKFKDGSAAIKRDIVFAASLYL